MAFTISSDAFKPGGRIPRDNTCDGKDASPALTWEGTPPGAQAFALICDDPDAPAGTWVHWVIFNIPSSAKGLAQGVHGVQVLPDGSAQGRNDFGKVGWGGPCPPRGKPHRYFFKLYALKEMVHLAPGASKKDLLKAIAGKVVGEAEIIGTYGR